MIKPVVIVKINGEVIPSSNISDVTFICDIDDVYPKGKLTLSDQSGELLSEYKGLEIGAIVSIGVVEESQAKSPLAKIGVSQGMYFCNLLVAAVAEIPSDPVGMKGNIEILLVHPWAFYKDFDNHLYNGVQNSEIIKNILKSNARGIKIQVKDKWIESSDDDGKTPKYKICESDFDFITKKVLPYTTINQSPALFWIDEKNRAHLHGIENLFTQDPSALAYGASPDLKNDPVIKAEGLVIGDKFIYNSLMVKVGDENISDFLAPLKAKAFIDLNTEDGKTMLGTVKTNIKVSKNMGSNINATMPLVDLAILGATDSKVCVNRNVNDQSSYLLNTTSPFVNMFRLELAGNFVGDSVRVGTIVKVYIPARIKEFTQNEHWLSGPWLVKKVKHTMTRDSNFGVKSQIVLVRPTFVVNPNKTKMPNLKDYQEV